MKVKGINYDIGTFYTPGHSTREHLSFTDVGADFSLIKDELHCNAVRIYGQDIDVLIRCSELALRTGLDVWISPRLINGDEAGTLHYIEKCAEKSEQLRKSYPERTIVFMVGCEFSIDTRCFVQGETIHERGRNLFRPVNFVRIVLKCSPTFKGAFSKFIAEAAQAARGVFNGKISYAAALWEDVDWTVFDIVGVNYYRASFNASRYAAGLKKFFTFNKPVAITEFGCCCYEGADRPGPAGYRIVDWTSTPPKHKKLYRRSEETQATYLTDLAALYDRENVYGAFIFTFIDTTHPHSDDPMHDLDMASFSIVKTRTQHLQESEHAKRWEPKLAYRAMSKYFGDDINIG